MSSTREKILAAKIKLIQLDPFGFCNAKCWFCPVRYHPLPSQTRKHMPLALADKIFAQIAEEKKRPDGLVDPSCQYFYAAHYSETLLYKHFEELLQIASGHGMKLMLLSNGTTLTPERTDTINRHRDAVAGLCLNIPAFEKELWARRAGMPPGEFDKLVHNVGYCLRNAAWLQLSIQVNGVDETTFANQWTNRGPEFDSLAIDTGVSAGELERQFMLAKELFPTANVYKNNNIVDRVGLITNVVSQRDFAEHYSGKKVIGCNNLGDRTTSWLHVNAAGDVFICCDDYFYDYKFGNLETDSLRDIWGSELHCDTVEKAQKQMCVKCSSAVWGSE